MPNISAVGLYSCDKFEETKKQKVIDLSNLTKSYFNRPSPNNSGTMLNYLYVRKSYLHYMLGRTEKHFAVIEITFSFLLNATSSCNLKASLINLKIQITNQISTYSTLLNKGTVCAYCFWDRKPSRACLLDTVR